MMTTALNSLRYDSNTYAFDVKQSVGPGSYVLGTPVPHCSPCFANDSRLIPGTSGDSICADIAMIDVDSELQGITRRATNDPTGKYLPSRPCSMTRLPDCRGLSVEDTRLNNPPMTLRGTGWNRWEWLCTNPQERALIPFDTLVDTSLVVKDNHRPMLTRPVDPTLALPPGKFDRPTEGAPVWVPSCQPQYVSPIPTMHWRSCAEIDRIQNGTA